MFQNLARPALFGGPRQKVVHLGGKGVQADLFQLRRQAIARRLSSRGWASSS
jgi:hypothetical protein